jgi:hypothetical protein
MNLQWVNGELIDMDAPVYATTASNTTNPVVQESLTPDSAGLSKAEFFTLIDAAYRNDEPRDLYMAREAYRALAQRLREVEQERDDAEKRADRLFQDRHDLLATKTTEGLSAAEWQMRTAAAERRLREVEDRLSTVIRVSQEYAGEAAQAQRRLAQLEAQDKARS